jgi:hypothetical protein
VINPPDPKKKEIVLHCGYTNVIHTINNQGGRVSEEVVEEGNNTPVPIYITYDSEALIFNGFTYFMTNPSGDPIPATISSAAETSAAGAGTLLSISFLVGELSYDVTTPDRAANRMSVGVSSKRPPWKPDGKTSSSGLITFTFRP